MPISPCPEVNYGYRYEAAHRLIKLTDSRGGKQLSYAWSPGGLLNTLADSEGHRTDLKNSVSATFEDGTPLQATIDALRSGKQMPGEIAPIRLFEQDGLTFTLDNRRLFTAIQAGKPVNAIPATSEEIANEAWKFTTPNAGSIVCLKRGCVQ